ARRLRRAQARSALRGEPRVRRARARVSGRALARARSRVSGLRAHRAQRGRRASAWRGPLDALVAPPRARGAALSHRPPPRARARAVAGAGDGPGARAGPRAAAPRAGDMRVCPLSFRLERGGFELWFSRDERRSRAPARPPALTHTGGTQVLAPRDPEGGGTW